MSLHERDGRTEAVGEKFLRIYCSAVQLEKYEVD